MDLTPAAWDFLADVAREWGASWARALMNAMAPTKDPRGPLIAELDGQPVLQEAADFISTKVTPTHRQEALL